MYNKEQLELVIRRSKSYKEVLATFKMNTSGGNYKSLKGKIELWSIDISHFITRKEICKIAQAKKSIHLNDILVKNSKFNNGNTLKTKLYKEGLKQPICEECSQNEEWRGKKLGLVLEHIDGDHYNNEITNLKILCPNCHAITNTFAGKNRTDKKRNEKLKHIKQVEKDCLKEELKQKIINSNIDLKKQGWGIKLSKLLGKSPVWCLKLVKEKYPELLK